MVIKLYSLYTLKYFFRSKEPSPVDKLKQIFFTRIFLSSTLLVRKVYFFVQLKSKQEVIS